MSLRYIRKSSDDGGLRGSIQKANPESGIGHKSQNQKDYDGDEKEPRRDCASRAARRTARFNV